MFYRSDSQSCRWRYFVSCILSAAEPVTGPVHCCKFIGWLKLGLGFPSNDVGLASLVKCT